jgi:hypothetical protein
MHRVRIQKKPQKNRRHPEPPKRRETAKTANNSKWMTQKSRRQLTRDASN